MEQCSDVSHNSYRGQYWNDGEGVNWHDSCATSCRSWTICSESECRGRAVWWMPLAPGVTDTPTHWPRATLSQQRQHYNMLEIWRTKEYSWCDKVLQYTRSYSLLQTSSVWTALQKRAIPTTYDYAQFGTFMYFNHSLVPICRDCRL